MAKLADFGLAKALDMAGLSGMTATGTGAGTPTYMPRQQLLDYKYAKPEVDVWAEDATIYTMLTGAIPRDFKRGQDPWLTVLQTSPVPTAQRNPGVPPRIAEVLDEALVDQPDLRVKTAAQLTEMLQSAL